jgi:hypothetical protein
VKIGRNDLLNIFGLVQCMVQERSVVCCPKCKMKTEAKDYMMPLPDSLLPMIKCECGYSAIPIKLTLKEYLKLMAKKKTK